MQYADLVTSLQQVGKDPSRLIFEDELTGISNRRFLLNYLEHKVRWDELETTPVSLLMMDLDYFKRINDTYGHQSGDQALVFVARLLKGVSGYKWIPIRYAGDEFLVLMHGGQKWEALEVGERLRERVHQEPLSLEGKRGIINLTFSIGVASAPEDAEIGKELIEMADTALYHAKRQGRDRVADAAEVRLKVVSQKAALKQLESGTISSRSKQLAMVNESVAKFDHGESQFVLIEGAQGMGKSTFLEAVKTALAQDDTYVIKVTGVIQEAFRPYYLMTNILVALLSQREDKGASAFGQLTAEEIAYLATILPQLEGPLVLKLLEDEAIKREGVFNAVNKLIFLLLDYRPLALLVDDLHYADEATLMSLRRVMLSRQIPIFICGTRGERPDSIAADAVVPLEQFCAEQQLDLGIVTIDLKPFSAEDIATHLRALFPQLSVPDNFEENLLQATHGNPQFLHEILRKLAMDQKLHLVDHTWIIEPLEADDLPKSFEEVVKQKIEALGEEGRHLLAHASTFGEDVSLSFLTGSSEAMEAKVLEFIDQAASLGLVSSDYQLNDEVIRFVGKRVLEITYGNIQEGRRRELHERVGNYQEALYKKRLLPSASPLVYHFERSANRGKAERYENIVAAHGASVFNSQETASYKGVEPGESGLYKPLDPTSMSHVPTVIRSLQTAVRNMTLYPPTSKNVVNSNLEFTKAVQKILANNEQLSIVLVKQAMLVNGRRVTDVSEYEFVAQVFLNFLGGIELQGITFLQGVSDEELKTMLDGLAKAKPEHISQGYWEQFVADRGLSHIHFRQARSHGGSQAKAIKAAAVHSQAPPESAMGLQQAGGVEAGGAVTERVQWVAEQAKMERATGLTRGREITEESVEGLVEGPLEEQIESLPKRAHELFLKGRGEQIDVIIQHLFQDFHGIDQLLRIRVIEAYLHTLAGLQVGYKQEFIKRTAEPILRAFAQEQQVNALGRLGELLHQMAISAIQFGESRLANRLLSELSDRLRLLEQSKDPKAQALAKILGRRIDSGTQKLLVEDLRSGDAARQQNVAQMLGSLGIAALPILIETIKQPGELRVRHIAASLLGELGQEAANAYKHELVRQLDPDERVRLLEVADSVTKALGIELRYALSDSHPEVRQAAYRLIERLNDKQVARVLVDYAKHGNPSVAVEAIACLGKLKPAGLTAVLSWLLRTSKEPERQTACCQVIGRLGDAAAVAALTDVVAPKGFFRSRKRYHPDVRAAAAYALSRIGGPLVTRLLATLVNDQDPRVREIARVASKHQA